MQMWTGIQRTEWEVCGLWTSPERRDVQRALAAKISEAVVTSRIPIKVIAVQDDGTLILNYGSVFLAPGDRLVAFQVGESFVDPDTGEVLGADETEVGMVEITRAEAKFSRARVAGNGGVPVQILVGDTLKRVSGTDDNSNDRKRSGDSW